VDDEAMLRRVMVRVLSTAGYEVTEAGSGLEALDRLGRAPYDLVISDIHMPHMDGMQLLAQVRALFPDVAVVMITAVSDVQTAVACLSQGALDYVGKPFQVDEVVARVRQALERRRLILENRDYQRNLEQRVRVQADKIRDLFVLGVQTLAHALEAKDPYTRGHSMRVAAYSTAIAGQLGFGVDEIAEIRVGAELHDVGKIGVREAVLLKPTRLDEDEYLHIMEHTVIGERILQPLLQEHPSVLKIVRSHHERMDGRGFPDKLAAEHIPIQVRIVTVSDTFDAMTTARPYRHARDIPSALEELSRCTGSQFDPDVVAAFVRAYPDPTQLPTSVTAGSGALTGSATSLAS
jgi:putative nucleotidyltransferase with HDIG domain